MAPPSSDSDRMAGAALKGLQFTAEWAPRSDYTLSEFERRTGKAVTGSSVWRNPRVRLADVKEPPLPAKDVRIRPRACGVCGSDVHFYETDEQGALCEPTSVAYNGMFVRAGGFKPGGVVAVYGTGPIGFAAIALARAAGASRVIAFEVSPVRQALARQVGADEVHDPAALTKQGGTPHEVVLRASGGAGADLAVEAA